MSDPTPPTVPESLGRPGRPERAEPFLAEHERERGRNAARAVFLVRPARFGANPGTRATNAFQAAPSAGEVDVQAAAVRELDGLASALAAAGARVLVVEDTPDPPKPDAVFPNNWVSLHADGTAVLYPLLAPSRRTEVRPELLDALRTHLGARVERVLDLTGGATTGAFLEGTGSLVLDRPRGLALACRSARTTPAGLAAFAAATGYDVLAFDALDEDGRPYYHTNVVASVGDHVALAALEALPDADEREAVGAALAHGGRAVVPLTRAQVRAFAANVLELEAVDGTPLLALSTRAAAALTAEQRATLEARVRLVAVPFDTIEAVGGGGVRCALAGVHAPLAADRGDAP